MLLELVQQDFSIVGDFGHEFVDEGGELLFADPHGDQRLDAHEYLIADEFLRLGLGRLRDAQDDRAWNRGRGQRRSPGLWLRRERVSVRLSTKSRHG